MLPTKGLFLDHVRWLRWAAKAHGLEVLIELDSMTAFVRGGDRHWVLLPQFIATIDGVARYVRNFRDDATHLAGWIARPTQGWPVVRDKLAFKRAVVALGLLTPDFSLDGARDFPDTVVKGSGGSFGENVHGPYRSSRERSLDIAAGEYYERFVEGDVLKIWFWEGTAIALECDRLPTVEGDGVSTVRELVTRRLGPWHTASEERMRDLLGRCADMLRFDGLALDHVPAAGTRRRIDFRYGTALMSNADRTVVDLRQPDPQWDAVRALGGPMQSLVPAEQRSCTLYTVDALRDREGRIWLLEMNGNPSVQPLAYDAMLASLVALPPEHARRIAPRDLTTT